MTDFIGLTDKKPVLLWPGDKQWGFYKIECGPKLPAGSVIQNAEVESFLRGVPANILSIGAEHASGTDVWVKFDTVATTTPGIYFLRLRLDLGDGMIKWLEFGPVKVRKWPGS